MSAGCTGHEGIASTFSANSFGSSQGRLSCRICSEPTAVEGAALFELPSDLPAASSQLDRKDRIAARKLRQTVQPALVVGLHLCRVWREMFLSSKPAASSTVRRSGQLDPRVPGWIHGSPGLQARFRSGSACSKKYATAMTFPSGPRTSSLPVGEGSLYRDSTA